MYSWEIDNIIKQNNYTISADTYINICSTSPQINYIHYEPYDNYFEIYTDDRYSWKFTVYRKD